MSQELSRETKIVVKVVLPNGKSKTGFLMLGGSFPRRESQ